MSPFHALRKYASIVVVWKVFEFGVFLVQTRENTDQKKLRVQFVFTVYVLILIFITDKASLSRWPNNIFNKVFYVKYQTKKIGDIEPKYLNTAPASQMNEHFCKQGLILYNAFMYQDIKRCLLASYFSVVANKERIPLTLLETPQPNFPFWNEYKNSRSLTKVEHSRSYILSEQSCLYFLLYDSYLHPLFGLHSCMIVFLISRSVNSYLSNIKDGAFFENSVWLTAINYFFKEPLLRKAFQYRLENFSQNESYPTREYLFFCHWELRTKKIHETIVRVYTLQLLWND